VRKTESPKGPGCQGKTNYCCGEGKDVSSAFHNVFSLINSSSSSSIFDNPVSLPDDQIVSLTHGVLDVDHELAGKIGSKLESGFTVHHTHGGQLESAGVRTTEQP